MPRGGEKSILKYAIYQVKSQSVTGLKLIFFDHDMGC